MRTDDAADRIVDAALDRFGALDVLVNNAVGQFAAAAETISDKGWRAVAQLNVDAELLAHADRGDAAMIRRGGGLVGFIGLQPRARHAGFAYAIAARSASGSAAPSLGSSWSQHGIRKRSRCARVDPRRGLDNYEPDDVAEWEVGLYRFPLRQ